MNWRVKPCSLRGKTSSQCIRLGCQGTVLAATDRMCLVTELRMPPCHRLFEILANFKLDRELEAPELGPAILTWPRLAQYPYCENTETKI